MSDRSRGWGTVMHSWSCHLFLLIPPLLRFLNMIVIRELEKCTGPLHVVIGNPCDYSLRCRHGAFLWFFARKANVWPNSVPESLPEENVTPLAVLPFISTNFKIPCIQVRVTFKSRLHDPRHPTQNLGFYIHLMDESGEVRAEVDTDLLADEIYDRFQVGRLYNIYHSGHKGFFEGRTFLYNLKDRSLLDISSWTVIEEVCSTKSLRMPFNLSLFSSAPSFPGHRHTASVSLRYLALWRWKGMIK